MNNYLKKAISYRGASDRNNPPTDIKSSQRINIFKDKLKVNKSV